MIDTHAKFSLSGMRAAEIFSPRDAAELAECLAQCNADKRAVVPWGGGTLQHLGNAPTRYDAVICTTGLNQVVGYAPDDLTATFGAGMTLAEIGRVLEENGQFLPIDVPHPERATIGGVLASGMNGGLRLRYGPARDFMLGNRFATVDGQIIKAGSKVVKNVAGYELHKVQVGALGTLGILTEATFKLFPKMPEQMSVWATFDNLENACAAVPLIWNLATPPLAIELMDRGTASMVDPNGAGEWCIAARFGGTKATMAAARDLCMQAAKEKQARGAEVIADGARFWEALADMPATMRENEPGALLVRASVPPKELQAALRILIDSAPTPLIFAHAAVTSIYARYDGDETQAAGLVTGLRERLRDVHGHLVVESVPGDLEKKIEAWDEVGDTFRLMRALKHKFDPNNILNPGRFVGGI